jgi:hypothetical protein
VLGIRRRRGSAAGSRSREIEVGAEALERQYRDRARLEVPLPEVHLVEARDRRARGEVTDGRADGTFARLALDAEGRRPVPQDDEVDFPLVGVAKKPSFRSFFTARTFGGP